MHSTAQYAQYEEDMLQLKAGQLLANLLSPEFGNSIFAEIHHQIYCNYRFHCIDGFSTL